MITEVNTATITCKHEIYVYYSYTIIQIHSPRSRETRTFSFSDIPGIWKIRKGQHQDSKNYKMFQMFTCNKPMSDESLFSILVTISATKYCILFEDDIRNWLIVIARLPLWYGIWFSNMSIVRRIIVKYFMQISLYREE